VFASLPAVALWSLARLPADWLAGLGGPHLAAILNHLGDTLFLAGWLFSGLRLWLTRRRPEAGAEPRSKAARPAGPSRKRVG